MYWQIILEGFDNLNGGPLAQFIVSIVRKARVEFVSVTDFEGSGILEPMHDLQGEGFISVDEFLPALSQLIQVDWATLLFSKTGLEKHGQNDEETRFAIQLMGGVTVVRCVDGQFVYVYTGDDALKEYISEHYECQAIAHLGPESFEWPG